jgi:hypothetical protein
MYPQRMKLLTMLLVGMSCALPAMAQERGAWRAASKTAQSVTGDIGFGNEKLTINFLTVPLAEIRPLTPAEVSAAFDGADASAGAGHLFRMSIAGDKRFLHKNTLCGAEETKWMATWVSGKTLKVMLFSNDKPPVFTIDALNSSTDTCGTFMYVR